jgi:hypothetical protein
VTGINGAGETVSNSEIFKKFANIKNKITEEDRIRLISTLHSCLDISEKEFNLLADTLNDTKKRPIFNMSWLGIIILLI